MKTFLVIIFTIAATSFISTQYNLEFPLPIIPEPDELNIYDAELSIFELINRERIKVSIAPLIWKKYSHGKAREHSEYMAKTGDFEHSTLNFYENILMIPLGGNTNLPYEAVNSWMNSPGHKANLLNRDIVAAGIGVAISNQGRAYITYMAD